MPSTVAIMQPYFIPYAGYFRLLVASDLFVIYDCVQFPRRGWVHRNKLIDATGAERWMTMPLAKAPRDVLIRDLEFRADASEAFEAQLRLFPNLQRNLRAHPPIAQALAEVNGTPVDYIERLLATIASYLDLPWKVIRSSSLGIPQSLHGQARILEIADRLGARCYVNAPGGRGLYSQDEFDGAGVKLSFLTDYTGSTSSILTRILTEDRVSLAADIRAASKT